MTRTGDKSNLIAMAWEMAVKAHRGQSWGDLPYTEHLIRVEEKLVKYCANDDLIIVGILHDIVEDTDTTLESIEYVFGENIKNLVWRLTDEKGQNRKERKTRTYPKLSQSQDAILVKICDRLVNMEKAIEDNDCRHLSKYIEEYREFRENLCIKELNSMIEPWKDLDLFVAYAKGKLGYDWEPRQVN